MTGRPVWGWLRAARTRRLVLAGFAQTRTANPAGRLPRVLRIRRTAVGERLQLSVRPGQSAELLDARLEELRAAARARDVRITRDPNRSHRVLLDVVRRDPLAASADVAWLDRDRDALSLWQPIHLGVAETGDPVRLTLVERSLLVGGEPGSGKSSLLNVVISHAAQSPDAHLVLIDPNEVQFYPWRDRALAYASDDPADALEVLELVRAEIRRRLALLKTLPGVVRKLEPTVAAEHDLPLWVLGVDELAFHTSVVGTPAQRTAFSTAARDVVTRCRAAGIVPVMATQRPTSDVVPTSLRDLFSLRCALRTTTKTSSDVILGDGWARQGFSATDIDLAARGLGWLLAEGQQPHRIKVAWISDDTTADLAVLRPKPRLHRTNRTPPIRAGHPRQPHLPAHRDPAPHRRRPRTARAARRHRLAHRHVLYKPCGTRFASLCPPCAEVYRWDTYQLIKAGLSGGKGVPETAARHPAVFATLTAPSFGAVHNRVTDPRSGSTRPCRPRRDKPLCTHGRPMWCSHIHHPGDRRIGQPLCLDCYDHAHHVVRNHYAPKLWDRTMVRLRRLVAAEVGPKVAPLTRVSFVKIAEVQARAAVHLHALVRFDGVDPDTPDAILPPPAIRAPDGSLVPVLSAERLETLVAQAAAEVAIRSPQQPPNAPRDGVSSGARRSTCAPSTEDSTAVS